MQATLYAYNLFIKDPTDRAKYEAIVAKMKARGTECFRALAEDKHAYFYEFASGENGVKVTLATDYIFNNQWNTTPIKGVSENGLRVFDWAEYASEAAGLSPDFKCGHYLELSPELIEARTNRGACGYCGKQYDRPFPTFCGACIGSEYLDEETLLKGATRVYPVALPRTWTPLTDVETAEILPKWKDAQINGATQRDRARIEKERDALAKEYSRAVNNAETKFNGYTWLMDRGINTSNVIFYDHTHKFSIGWRNPVGESLRADWEEKMRDFPYPWEFAKSR